MIDPQEFPTAGLLSAAYNAVSATIVARIVDAGYGDVRPAHGNVMEALSFADGLRLTDLAERAGITPQSMGELVDELEDLGYVDRRPDPTDRRAKRVHLTRRGRENVRTGYEIVLDVERRLEELLGERRLRSLRRSLEEIVRSETGHGPVGPGPHATGV